MLRLLEPEDSALQLLQEVTLGISGLEKALDDIHIKTSKLRCVVLLQPDPAEGAGVRVHRRTGQMSGRNVVHKSTSLRGKGGTYPAQSGYIPLHDNLYKLAGRKNIVRGRMAVLYAIDSLHSSGIIDLS